MVQRSLQGARPPRRSQSSQQYQSFPSTWVGQPPVVPSQQRRSTHYPVTAGRDPLNGAPTPNVAYPAVPPPPPSDIDLLSSPVSYASSPPVREGHRRAQRSETDPGPRTSETTHCPPLPCNSPNPFVITGTSAEFGQSQAGEFNRQSITTGTDFQR
jgi:hypothetical protein